MAELSLEDKCKQAATLIARSPPGEVNDVVNDIRAIIGDDEALMAHVVPALAAYNLEQLVIVEHTAADGMPAHQSLLSVAAKLPGSDDRFVDAPGKRSFVFDHVAQAASKFEPYELPETEETFRGELAKSLAAYAKNHFPSGASSVSCSQFPLIPPPPSAPAPSTSDREEPVAAVPESSAPAPQEPASAEPVTDEVDELVGSGDAEPAPTPAAPDAPAPLGVHEVIHKDDLQEVDHEIEAAKEEEDKEGDEAEEEAAEAKADPTVEDATAVPQTSELQHGSADEPRVEEEEAAAAPVQEQKRVENPVYTLEVVGNRYNPSNYWTGRWRTCWVVDPAASKVDGTIKVDVHYYEQGNLETRHTASFPLPEASASQSVASQVVSTIAKIETTYQHELNDTYGDLGDKAFRALRRALPITRQKVDWDKVGGYSLGADLTKARG